MIVREGATPRIVIWTLTVFGLLVIYAPPLYLLGVSFNPALQPGLPHFSDITLKWYLALGSETALVAALG